MRRLGRVLVTGADGFLGSHLVPLLRSRGADVIQGLRNGGGDAGVVPIDLRARANVEAALRSARPDMIVNLAAIADPGAAEADPELAYDVNVLGQLRLIRAVLQITPHARLVTLGTAHQYGAPDSAQPVTEDAPFRPNSVYATTKAAADLQALQYHLSDGLDLIRLRLFNLIGPGRSADYFPARQVRRMAKILDHDADASLATFSLAGAIDFVDVRDACTAIAAVLERGVDGAAYNVARGRAVPLREVIERLIVIADRDARIDEVPRAASGRRTSSISGDASRIRRDTGWEPRVSLDDSLRDALEFERATLRRTSPSVP